MSLYNTWNRVEKAMSKASHTTGAPPGPLRTAAGELESNGYCILRSQFALPPIDACREAFWPVLKQHLAGNKCHTNRGPQRHFLPLPFQDPIFSPAFFFDAAVKGIVQDAMTERIVADQWGCDVPLLGSTYQQVHADYQRPLFGERPGLQLPPYMLVVSFGLTDIGLQNGPVEIAPGTHLMPRPEAMRAIENSQIRLQPIQLAVGDVLIRHPWALHRGTPNLTDVPRALLTIRYVRSWYTDESREVQTMPQAVWKSLTAEQQQQMRFPISTV